MSIYTEAEHAVALTDTQYWISHPPVTPMQRYLFGRYHYRLKDYNEAFHWFCLALSDHISQAWFDLGECLRNDLIDDESMHNSLSMANLSTCFPDNLPDSEICYNHAWNYYCSEKSEDKNLPSGESLYRRGFLLRYGLGVKADTAAAHELFSEVIRLHSELTSASFDICCDYSGAGTSDGGTVVSSPVEVCKLPAGSALFELAKYELDTNPSSARSLLKKAYDFHCEDALFFNFLNFGQDYASYAYQDDIRELYSFRIGQYTRVHDINPSEKALDRLARMYENGYPGDNEERRNAFALKAVPIRKKIAALQDSRQVNS